MSAVDPGKAADVSKMRHVEYTQAVSVDECKAMLREQKWKESVIAELFKDYTPPRVHVGNVMLIVKK